MVLGQEIETQCNRHVDCICAGSTRNGERAFSVSVDSAPSGRGFSRHGGLSSDDSFRSVHSARGLSSRAAEHRLDEPKEAIPQHGCIPAEPASVSPGGVIVTPHLTVVHREEKVIPKMARSAIRAGADGEDEAAVPVA